MRKRTGESIRSFLDSQGEKWGVAINEYPEGKVLMLSKNGMSFPVQSVDMLRGILAYQNEHVLHYSNVGRGDCVDVAIRFQEAFEKSQEFAPLAQRGYVLDRITAGNVVGNPLSYLHELGHRFHEMNVIEFPEEEGGPVFAAVDLTAHYNMDVEKGEHDVFIVIAPTRAEMLEALHAVTKVKWSGVFE